MAKQKREINEEFADVWSEIVSERVEVLKQKLMEETDEKKARYFDGYIDGIVETLTLFSCLEQGRFQNKWEETLEKLHREQEEK